MCKKISIDYNAQSAYSIHCQRGATGKVVTMKWIVVSFDEESKLYTVQNEHGRTCRADQGHVVYGVEGRKLKSVPRYAEEVFGAIRFHSLFNGKDVKTTDFGVKLLMEACDCCSADIETLISFANDNLTIINDLESYAKVTCKKLLFAEDSVLYRARNLFCKILKSMTFDKLTPEKAHEYIRSLIYFLNCDKWCYNKLDKFVNDYDATIKAAKVFKQMNGIAFHGIDDEIIRQRKYIAFPYMVEYPDFAISLVTKTYIDDLVTVFCVSDARRAIENYVTKCKVLEIEPCLKGNILTLFASTSRLYEQKKDELKAKALHKMAERFEWLGEFSCNGMGVVIFETPEDFSTEGEVQHNCVNRYGYLDEMANGGTLICGVRKLDDIDTPFITCEVRLSNDGTAIGVAQFYRAFNERPSAPEESEFLREFAEFIHNHN